MGIQGCAVIVERGGLMSPSKIRLTKNKKPDLILAMKKPHYPMHNEKDKTIIGALSIAYEQNFGEEGLDERHIERFLEILQYHEVDADSARYYLSEAIGMEGTTDELINETVSILVENAYEAAMETYDYDRDGDYDGHYGKQFYQNARGRCEDSPCCGCCGYF